MLPLSSPGAAALILPELGVVTGVDPAESPSTVSPWGLPVGPSKARLMRRFRPRKILEEGLRGVSRFSLRGVSSSPLLAPAR